MSNKIIVIIGFILLGFTILERVQYYSNTVVFIVYPEGDPTVLNNRPTKETTRRVATKEIGKNNSVFVQHPSVQTKNNYVSSVLNNRLPTKKEKMFIDYLKKYNRSYDSIEFSRRFQLFKKNLRKNRLLNAKTTTATYGVTKFSDWSPSELRRILSPVGDCESRASDCAPPSEMEESEEESSMIPTGNITLKLDWREHGAVGPILDQKLCPICWAFSIAGVAESMAFIYQRVKKLTRLSIQELTDCSFYSSSDRTGCLKGRPMVEVFEYLCDNSMRLATEREYPLTFSEENCKGTWGPRSLKRFENKCDLHNNENELIELLKKGPVTAAVNAHYLFNYISGIITENCEVLDSNDLNHAVQIVGYDMSGPIPYYIVRNSWGKDWGEAGYAYLSIGSNQCGIAYSIGHVEVY